MQKTVFIIMKSSLERLVLAILLLMTFAACKSVKLPSVEVSQKVIDNYKVKVDSLDRLIN